MYEWRLDEIIVLKSERQAHWNTSGRMDCYCGLPFRYTGQGNLNYVSGRQFIEGEATRNDIIYWIFKKSDVDILKTKLLHELLERWN